MTKAEGRRFMAIVHALLAAGKLDEHDFPLAVRWVR